MTKVVRTLALAAGLAASAAISAHAGSTPMALPDMAHVAGGTSEFACGVAGGAGLVFGLAALTGPIGWGIAAAGAGFAALVFCP